MPYLEWQTTIIILSICLRKSRGVSSADSSIPSFHPAPSWIDSIGVTNPERNSQSAAVREFDFNTKVVFFSIAAPISMVNSMVFFQPKWPFRSQFALLESKDKFPDNSRFFFTNKILGHRGVKLILLYLSQGLPRLLQSKRLLRPFA